MARYVLFGAGYMGKVMAKNILESDAHNTVSIIDSNEQQLREASRYVNSERLSINAIDLRDVTTAVEIVKNHEIVISALPHSVALLGLQIAVEAKVSIVDIVGEAPEKQLELDVAAKEAGIVVLPDMGVAPGLSNICVGRGVELLDETEEAVIYVGGIPVRKEPPLYYQTLYRLKSVLNAYQRKVPIFKDGALVEVEPLTGIELLQFPDPIGNLEAFYTDGLNSLLVTMQGKISKNLAEKTLRYFGHIDRIKVLKECGLLDQIPVVVNGKEISPIDVTVASLTPLMTLSDAGDYLIMRVIVKGRKNSNNQIHTFELLDTYDPETHYTAMARTTGFPALITANMILDGKINKKGVQFPELIFRDALHTEFMSELEKYNIRIVHTIK